MAAVSGPAPVATPRWPASASCAPEDLERRQTMWWYLLIGALGFLASETVVLNGLSRRALDPDRPAALVACQAMGSGLVERWLSTSR